VCSFAEEWAVINSQRVVSTQLILLHARAISKNLFYVFHICYSSSFQVSCRLRKRKLSFRCKNNTFRSVQCAFCNWLYGVDYTKHQQLEKTGVAFADFFSISFKTVRYSDILIRMSPPVNIQRVTLKIPSETHGGPHVTCRHRICEVHFGGEYVNIFIHLIQTKTPCYNWQVWTYVNGRTIWLNVRVNSTDLQGGECFLWNAKALWSQQVIRGM